MELLTELAEKNVTDNKWYDDTFNSYWDMVEEYENQLVNQMEGKRKKRNLMKTYNN